MKNLLKNKRGMAIESAIFFMLVTFMLGFLLTGVAMTAHLRVNFNDTLLKREMEIEQIGENFVSMNQTDFATYIQSFGGKYVADLQNDNKTLVLTKKSSGNVLLKITVDENGKITSWKYSD